MGHTHAPTAAVIDAQSNRSSPQGGESGFDAGKKVKGRKRNLVVDTMGSVIALTVTAASVQDRDAARCSCRASVFQSAWARKALHQRCERTKVCSRHRAVAPYSYRSRTASRKRHDGNLARRCASNWGGRRNQTQGSWLCRSAGSSSEHMRGLSASVVRSCITTAEARMLLNRLAYWV
jgi:hypothetical protein